MTTKKISNTDLLDLVRYPIITDKTTRLLESNKYTFAIDKKVDKQTIKTAIEYIFDVKVTSINTSNIPPKKRRLGRFVGYKSSYKKAIITLALGYSINIFPES
uniref:Large ribosomal subunit protein uL23c n=1 Tax=Gronococcus sybilensis TaxID=3028029 RepID=A0A9Y1MXS9_9RHOD|nr:ribosomal protein L23 [Gronococcus sybilensis]